MVLEGREQPRLGKHEIQRIQRWPLRWGRRRFPRRWGWISTLEEFRDPLAQNRENADWEDRYVGNDWEAQKFRLTSLDFGHAARGCRLSGLV